MLDRMAVFTVVGFTSWAASCWRWVEDNCDQLVRKFGTPPDTFSGIKSGNGRRVSSEAFDKAVLVGNWGCVAMLGCVNGRLPTVDNGTGCNTYTGVWPTKPTSVGWNEVLGRFGVKNGDVVGVPTVPKGKLPNNDEVGTTVGSAPKLDPLKPGEPNAVVPRPPTAVPKPLVSPVMLPEAKGDRGILLKLVAKIWSKPLG